MNTIKYRDLRAWYLDSPECIDNAKNIFGKKQPRTHQIGFYSAPSWNWGYIIGITGMKGRWYEVVTQFGEVKAAREIYLPKNSTF